MTKPEWGTGLPPLSPHPFLRERPPASASLRMFLSRRRIANPEEYWHTSALRRCSASARNTVRLPFGNSDRVRRNPQRRFWSSDARRNQLRIESDRPCCLTYYTRPQNLKGPSWCDCKNEFINAEVVRHVKIGMMRPTPSFLLAKRLDSWVCLTAPLPRQLLSVRLSIEIFMKRLCICILAPIVLTAWPAFGQDTFSGVGPSDGVKGGEASFQDFQFLPVTVRNAPYSGETVKEFPVKHSDGSQTTASKMLQKVWRDSQGRIRTEDPSSAMFVISDPVARFMYAVDTVNRVVHRVKVEEGPHPGKDRTKLGGGGLNAAKLDRLKAGVEDLGTKAMEGVVVAGTRITLSREGHPTTTTEIWESKELQLTLLRVEYDPATGPKSSKIINLSTNEPEPSLFTVPADYSIAWTRPVPSRLSGESSRAVPEPRGLRRVTPRRASPALGQSHGIMDDVRTRA